MHGAYAGPSKGNRNALKHGMRTAEATALRRQAHALLHAATELVEKV